ncbi:MAG: mechanosensitive ion channel [Candidatus Thorarchaeota archaeon]|nr:mechanosensitive ion channel [Candidatus Thorarchaeota archaeon]
MQTTTALPPPDLFIDPIGYLQYYFDQLFPYIIVVVSLLLLMLLYFVLTRLAKRSLVSIGMGIEASTGIVLVLRLTFFLAAVIIIVNAFAASLATILSLTAIFGTALGLAFSQALGNIVSGLYVLAARPFRVGDYVRVGGVEGIVREITLNYTRILLGDETRQLLPNNKVVSSEVTNFRVAVADILIDKEKQIEEAQGEKQKKSYLRSIDNAIDILRDMASDADAYRYTFDMNIHMSYDQKKMQHQFDEVCKKYEKVFLSRPSYQIWAKPAAAVTYRFTYIVDDPMKIIKMTSLFMSDLLEYYIEGEK